MRVNGLAIKEMGRDCKYGQMEHDMKENGKIIRHVGKDPFFMLMVIHSLDSGQRIELTVMEYINRTMVLSMKDTGGMIYNMEREKKNVVLYS